MYLKIAMVNTSGNMGKTTLCTDFLKPRIDGAVLIKVESINSDGTDDTKYRAEDFVEIFKEIDMAECAIVDVGSSNIEKFISQLNAYKGSQEDFDFFIVPATPKEKQQIDTLSTIEILRDLGVESERIRIVFNMVDDTQSFDKQFSTIINSKTYKSLKLKDTPVIPDTQVFTHLATIGKSFQTVAQDTRNFRELMRNATSPDERGLLSEERSVKRLVDGINETMDTAFQKLNIL